jgi:signal transduction histidine kinase
VGVAVTATLANLYFDPALPDPRYDWALPTPAVPPRAVPSVVSLTFGALIFGCCAYALVSLFRASSERSELRTAGLVTGLGVAGGATDLVAAAFQLPIPALAAQTAILPVIGISYVLAGRFTRIETELAERTDQLALNYERLRVAQAELVRREQLATVGELSAVIAHEVRNPLAIIKNAVGGLRRREVAEANSQTLLGILDEEADRLNRLVTDLLAYSRPISPEVGLVDLRVVVARAVELASGGSANAQSVDVDLDLDFAVDPVEGDEALLRHALINIVDNALQAMPQGGTLTITCRNLVVDGTAFVAVDFDDTGEGMDTLVRSKARDPFFTTRETGTGLGLAIVDRVARAHGGFVEIQSRHGLGSKVSFLVPRERPSGAPRESGAPEPHGP